MRCSHWITDENQWNRLQSQSKTEDIFFYLHFKSCYWSNKRNRFSVPIIYFYYNFSNEKQKHNWSIRNWTLIITKLYTDCSCSSIIDFLLVCESKHSFKLKQFQESNYSFIWKLTAKRVMNFFVATKCKRQRDKNKNEGCSLLCPFTFLILSVNISSLQ